MSVRKIKDFVEGETIVNYPFILKELKEGLTVTNKPFINMTLADKEEAIHGVIWDLIPGVDYEEIGKATFVLVDGEIGSYKGNLQVTVTRIQGVNIKHPVIEENIDLLLKRTHIDINAVYDNIIQDIDSFIDLEIATFLKEMLERNKFQFKTFPAAWNNHHAYYGGLIQHTWEMYQMVDNLPFEGINKELLKAGVILHDIGKTQEYLVNEVYQVVDMTFIGRTLGHITIGVNMISSLASELSISSGLAEKLMHMVAAHHRELEYGSPVKPAFKEAMILCYLDELSAKTQMIEKETEGVELNEFSERNFAKGLRGGYTKV